VTQLRRTLQQLLSEANGALRAAGRPELRYGGKG